MSIFDDIVGIVNGTTIDSITKVTDKISDANKQPNPNNIIFNDFDMVVSVTQKTINEQLESLASQGIIPSRLILKSELLNKNYSYSQLTSEDQITKDANGIPAFSCISATIKPQIIIAETGSNVILALKFTSGTAWLWQGFGPLAALKAFDMTGWSYGISTNLNLAELSKNDINQKITIPTIAADQLHNMIDNMFTVQSLFLNFESIDFTHFEPTNTRMNGPVDKGPEDFILFMQFYLQDLLRKGNPFVLGYSIVPTSQTQDPVIQAVPDYLKPTGTTYSLFYDPSNPDASNLNFVMVTKGGHNTIAGSPPAIQSNWFQPGDSSDAKMIFSHKCLMEPYVLMPLFNNIRDGVYNAIRGRVNVPPGKDYATALQSTAAGWYFTISNITGGNDQYQNTFMVSINNQGSYVEFDFSGHIGVYKEVSQNNLFCTARAHASGTMEWGGKVKYSVQSINGKPSLKMDNSFQITRNDHNSGKNDCASAFNWMGNIIGGIVGVFTGFVDGGYFSNVLSDAMRIGTPGIGDLNLAMTGLSDTVSSVVMLPAGQVFNFQNPSSDPDGNIVLQLNYQR